eukprot:5461779-Ditylum_brightwellii.AAC.1
MELPHVTQAKAATWAAIELTEALKAPIPKAIFGTGGSEKLEAIEKLAEMFKRHIKSKESVPPLRVEEKSPVKKQTRPSPRVEETITEIKPTMLDTRVTKPRNPHNGPHIILPDDGEESI